MQLQEGPADKTLTRQQPCLGKGARRQQLLPQAADGKGQQEAWVVGSGHSRQLCQLAAAAAGLAARSAAAGHRKGAGLGPVAGREGGPHGVQRQPLLQQLLLLALLLLVLGAGGRRGGLQLLQGGGCRAPGKAAAGGVGELQ